MIILLSGTGDCNGVRRAAFQGRGALLGNHPMIDPSAHIAVPTRAEALGGRRVGRLRVLLVSPSYHGGGMERCARELFHGLRRRDDVEATLAVRRPSPRLPPGVIGVQGAIDRWLEPVTLLPGVHDWTHRSGARLLRALTTATVDVVHLHSLVNTGLPLRGVAELSRRVPVVWTLHDEWAVTGGVSYDLSRFPDRRDRRRCSRHIGFERDARVAFVARRLARFPIVLRTVVSPSQWLCTRARESGRFADARFAVVRNGLTLLDEPSRGLARDEARRLLAIPPGDRVILLIAATLGVAYKGIRHAIEALRRLAGGGATGLTVVACGAGAEEVGRRLPGPLRVVATAASTAAELGRVYRAADLTVIPSLADNFPYVALESLACGTPLVAADCPGLLEIVTESEGGRLAPAGSAAGLATALASFLDDPAARAAAAARGRGWVERECRMEGFVDSMAAIYEAAARSA
jgi:glycosyltransferase involved in cell wall biosynthesis